MYQAIIFDMDGVLIDSKECMNMCWQEVQRIIPTTIEFELYFERIGKPFKVILYEIGLEKEHWVKAEKTYFNAQAHYLSLIKPYDQVEWMLKELEKKYILGLVTSKNSKAVNLILNQFNWTFSQVITPDNCARGKPYPDPLIYFTAYERLDPRKCIYIGDMVVDKMSAERAGFEFIRAGWGYQDFEAVTVKSPRELVAVIEGRK